MSRALIRSSVILGLAVVLVGAATTSALAADLEDYLTEAAEASFAGRQATLCNYAEQSEFSVVSVEHAGSLVMVEDAGSSQMVGAGRYSVIGDAAAGIALSDWSPGATAARYVTASASPETRLGRDVIVLTVEEEDAVRAKIWFDQETGAALGSEIYDGGGELFRLTWMLDFDPNPRKIFTMMRDQDSTYDIVVGADAGDLADSIAGYMRMDSYAGPDDSIHAFYTDGLFSFSIFLIEGEVDASSFAEADVMRVDGAEYRWLLTPSDLWLHWVGDDNTYVLVGDLPPDHLQEVLQELPRPSQGNILSRIWRGLFG